MANPMKCDHVEKWNRVAIIIIDMEIEMDEMNETVKNGIDKWI